MRIRSIKPEFWRSDDITALTVEDRLLFVGLWSYVDDNGVGKDDLANILGDLFAADWLRNPPETVARVSGGLRKLQTAGLITRYEASGKPLLHITTWSAHQRVEKPGKPRYPLPAKRVDRTDTASDQGFRLLPPDPRDLDPGSSGESPEDLPPGAGEQGNRGTGSRGTGEQGGAGGAADAGTPAEARPSPPPRQRGSRIPDPFIVTGGMRQWAAEHAHAVDVDRSTAKFVDHWRAKSGRDATKLDWLATWRNWLRTDHDRTRPGPAGPGPSRQSKDERALATLRLGTEPRPDPDRFDGGELLQLRSIS